MNGTSGFQEVRSSTSRLPSHRLLHEQRRQFRKGSWHLLRTHDLIAFSTGISKKQDKVADTLFMPPSTNRLLREQRHQFVTGSSHVLRARDLSASCSSNSKTGEKVPDTISSKRKKEIRRMASQISQKTGFPPFVRAGVYPTPGIDRRQENIHNIFFVFEMLSSRKECIVIVLLFIVFLIPACMRIDCSTGANSTNTYTKKDLNYVPDELLVTFKPGTDSLRMNVLNDSLHVQVITVLLGGQLNLVKIPADKSLDEIRGAYASFPEVESVGLNYKVVAQ